MKNYLKTAVNTLKLVFTDYLNIYFFSTLLLFFVADFFIWSLRLRKEDIYVFSLNGVYPLRFLGIIILVNSFLAMFSYEKEKEICYLLIGANIFISVLIFILECFYLINLSYG